MHSLCKNAELFVQVAEKHAQEEDIGRQLLPLLFVFVLLLLVRLISAVISQNNLSHILKKFEIMS